VELGVPVPNLELVRTRQSKPDRKEKVGFESPLISTPSVLLVKMVLGPVPNSWTQLQPRLGMDLGNLDLESDMLPGYPMQKFFFFKKKSYMGCHKPNQNFDNGELVCRLICRSLRLCVCAYALTLLLPHSQISVSLSPPIDVGFIGRGGWVIMNVVIN